MLLWTGNLIFLLSVPISTMNPLVAIFGFVVQTLLYTGLFITAHDAMHSSVYRRNRRINDLIGRIAVTLYALFSYRRLVTKHARHHKYPASPEDPDYHDGEHSGFLAWYTRFMLNYIRIPQILGMAVVFNLLLHLVGVNVWNIVLFWVSPALLSTVQLFYFGTFLPHREPDGGYTNRHRAETNAYPVFLSFLTCYHFGYHWEHHEFPGVSWWRLPAKRREVSDTTYAE